MNTEASIALLNLEKLIVQEDITPAQLAFSVYRIFQEAGMDDDTIENIGVIVSEIAAGE